MKEKADELSLKYDTKILDHPEALIVGSLEMSDSADCLSQ
jgi:hypothetical protein